MFEDRTSGASIQLVHVNVPDHAYRLVNPEAWNRMYWQRWKEHFSSGERPAKSPRS
jgi:hypothetical protein